MWRVSGVIEANGPDMEEGTMKRARTAMILLPLSLFAGGVWTAGVPAAAEAQDTLRTTLECRCVNDRGEELEDCVCMRGPSPSPLLPEMFQRNRRARLGITLDPGQDEEMDRKGAVILEVLEGGPADHAGLRKGDIVTALDGHDLREPLSGEEKGELDPAASRPVGRLLALVREIEPEEEIEVRYLRDGEEHTTTVTAGALRGWRFAFAGKGLERLRKRIKILGLHEGEMGAEAHEIAERARELGARARGLADRDVEIVIAGEGEGRGHGFSECPGEEGEDGRIFRAFRGACPAGLEMAALNPELGNYFGTDTGVLVVDVHPESTTGLEPGDVILRIGDREAVSPRRVRAILRSYDPDEEIVFHIRRKGKEISVKGRIGGEEG